MADDEFDPSLRLVPFDPSLRLRPRGGAGAASYWGSAADAGPTYSSNEWDIVWLSGIPLPGICEVKPGQITQLRVDQGKSPGRNGARLTITGYDPKDFIVTCEVGTQAQWDALQNAIKQLWIAPREKKAVTKTVTKKIQIGQLPDQSPIFQTETVDVGTNADGSTKTAKVFKTETTTSVVEQAGFKKAITIHHPSLVPFKVNKVIVIGVSPPVPGSQPGFKVVNWHLQEYRPPGKKNVAKTVKGTNDSILPAYEPGKAPNNGAPTRPSSNPKNLAPGGPPKKPDSGGH